MRTPPVPTSDVEEEFSPPLGSASGKGRDSLLGFVSDVDDLAAVDSIGVGSALDQFDAILACSCTIW